MANITPELREVGQANFHRTVGQLAELDRKGVTRRDFMKGLVAAGATVPIGAAAYFGYTSERAFGRPVRAGLIGAGDEGGVLVGEHNPAYLEFVAYSDIRPSNCKRIFEGETRGPRKGFKRIYGSDAEKHIKLYENYKDLLADKDIEAVVIALPLHLHAPVAIEAMDAGKHVLCEKLMAWNINQCKDMIRAARRNDRVLSIGHQRHYSLLYAHAVEVLRSGVLGDIHHIRAQWHRNNAKASKADVAVDPSKPDTFRDSWCPAIKDEDRKALESRIKDLGYKSMEELVRWRLFNRTGGGLMAELGSHQLDACSIFMTANAKRNYPDLDFGDFKLMPLAVSGLGGKYFYRDGREVDDHVFVTFEFPGQNYYAFDVTPDGKINKTIKDKDDIVIVTYSSINTNSFEPYGECVMGTQGTLTLEMEQTCLLHPEPGAVAGVGRATAVGVRAGKGGQPVLDASASTAPDAGAAQQLGQASLGQGTVSRGYREEMEHFAFCIRNRDEAMSADRPKPRCDGPAAMADAIMALTSNKAMRDRQRIQFDADWFDPESAKVPDTEMIPEKV